MDDIKPNQSLDGMQGGRAPQAGSTPQNVEVNDGSNNGGLNQFNDADYAPTGTSEQHIDFSDQQQHSDPVQPSGGSGKGLKVLLTLFVILFLAASAAAGYFYMQNNKTETPTTVSTVDVTKIQQENDALTYDNATLKTQNAHYVVQVKSLTTTAQQLKTKCGSSCSAIVIPQ